MNFHSASLCILFVLVANSHVSHTVDYDGWINVDMQHNLGCSGTEYCKRGSISVKSVRAGTAVIDQIQFSPEHIQQLKDLAEQDRYYSVKSLVSTAEHKDVEYLSSMKAQGFLESGLCDVINVWVLPNAAVTAVGFLASNATANSHQCNGRHVSSKFYLRHVDLAPVPDTASFIQKLEREREARERGDVKDTRSFLAKYWMYIVPVAIFVMISGANNPEAGAGAGAGPAARQ